VQTTPYSVWWAPGGAAVITMPAAIDLDNCVLVHASLVRAVKAGATIVIADLTTTGFCGYAGTEALVSVHAIAARTGTGLRVVAATPQAWMIEEIAGAGHTLDFYPDLTAALAGPRSCGTASRETATGRRLRLVSDAPARGADHQDSAGPAAKLRVIKRRETSL
jgi:anti-anti-sigma regulatory factor